MAVNSELISRNPNKKTILCLHEKLKTHHGKEKKKKWIWIWLMQFETSDALEARTMTRGFSQIKKEP